jgi:hypothetical protein
MGHRSVSPDSLSQLSLARTSTTPEILEEEEKKVSKEKMQGNYGSAFLLHSYKVLLKKSRKNNKFYKSIDGRIDSFIFLLVCLQCMSKNG